MLGSHRVLVPGTFDDYYSYGEVLTTNIFTMFRGLILDFGLIGSVLFMFATGLLLHWAFHTMLVTRRPVLTVAVFVFAMDYFFSSFGVSMLASSSSYLVFALLWIVLHFNELATRAGDRRLMVPGPTRQATARS